MKAEFAGKKKSVVYSLMTLVLLAPLILLAVVYSETSTQASCFVVTKAVGLEVENLAESIAADFPRALEGAGASAVTAAVNHVVSTGTPADDARARILELAENASYEGNESLLMLNNSLREWMDRLEAKALGYGFALEANLTGLNLSQQDASRLRFVANMSVEASSQAYRVNFSREYSAEALVSVEGVEDPLYPLNTNGLVQRVMSLNSSRVWGVTALDAVVTAKEYVPASNAPGFLSRLEGSTAPQYKYYSEASQSIGLESFVDLMELLAQDLEIKENKTVLDHLYFNETTPAGYAVNGSQHYWLKLDADTAARYGVELET